MQQTSRGMPGRKQEVNGIGWTERWGDRGTQGHGIKQRNSGDTQGHRYQLRGDGDSWGHQARSCGVRGQGHPDTQGTELRGYLGMWAPSNGTLGILGDTPTSFLAASVPASLSTTFCLRPKASRRLSSSRCSSRATRACSSPTSLLLLLFSLSRSFTCPRRRGGQLGGTSNG